MQENKPYILLVDDTPMNLDLLVDILMADYEIMVAINGVEAIECVKKTRPALILLDIMMPTMGGYETCEKLKSNDETNSIPIIFITGLDDFDDKMKGLSLGAVDFIAKPFNVCEVKSKVRAQISG